ncbi:hypothetical protein Misp01_17260 [Microtetraspora sp. NBRC 13810]|uniref:DUF2087 domain-containing protein n=1 Tax=Microtetraspora sp. NBRC 13810 TaxID=3030990 RepID=UPI0024A31760|nr:DUF2087 domain-containing protein [Microtetraspora sp. NBRC 13810]GLW06596.1 hypothetical protein Misp01_17260 [Microtetraspora sp. NBRC 13810]
MTTPADEEDRILRTFLIDGRLRAIPTRLSKRRVVLGHIAQSFEPGVHYPEQQVNDVLLAFHDDFAALRRYLVEEGLLDRQAGVYWRSGGPVDV